jgi:hypothetical protein
MAPADARRVPRVSAAQQPEGGQQTPTAGDEQLFAGVSPQQADSMVQTWPDGHEPPSCSLQLGWQTASSCML